MPQVDTSVRFVPRPALTLCVVLAMLTAACIGDSETIAGQDPDGVPVTAETSPSEPTSTTSSEPDTTTTTWNDQSETAGRDRPFTRLTGFTTFSELGDLGGDGLAAWRQQVPQIQDVRIPSTIDGTQQPALWLPPTGNEPRPLLVTLHTWSADYLQDLNIPLAIWAKQEGWGVIQPDFRGVNGRPESTGSDLAVQDVADAIDYAIAQGGIDADRVYTIGVSGGGMMSLLMAGRHPDKLAAAIAWSPEYDLTDWYEYSSANLPDQSYAAEIAAACGGDPMTDEAAAAECDRRSPSGHLDGAREAGLPVYVAQGLNDGLAPPVHAAGAFNQLADPGDRLTDDQLAALAENQLPEELDGVIETEPYFGTADPEVRYVAESGSAVLVIFEGGHDMAYHPGLEWLVRRGLTDSD